MPKAKARVYFLGFVFLLVTPLVWSQAAAADALPSERIPPDRLGHYAELAVQWQREYLRIDTTNPPGNEGRAAEFFKQIVDQEGIDSFPFC